MNLSKQSIRIIRDLVEKFPAGPTGSLRKHHYTMVNRWIGVYRRHTDVPVIRSEVKLVREEFKPFFGYDPVDLYKTGLNSEDRCVEAMAFVTPEATHRVRTRDGRRLWIRISDAFEWVRKNGTTGLWQASYREASWGTPLYSGIWIHADTRAEVEARVAVIAPMLGAKENWRPHVMFSELGSPAEAVAKNTSLVESFTRRERDSVIRAEKELAKAREALERATATAGQMMGAIMLASGADEEETNEEAE